MTTAEQTEERREVVAEEIQLELEEMQEKPAQTLPQRVDDWFILLGVVPRSVMPSGKADVIPARGRLVQTKELHLPCALYANCQQPFCALIPPGSASRFHQCLWISVFGSLQKKPSL